MFLVACLCPPESSVNRTIGETIFVSTLLSAEDFPVCLI